MEHDLLKPFSSFNWAGSEAPVADIKLDDFLPCTVAGVFHVTDTRAALSFLYLGWHLEITILEVVYESPKPKGKSGSHILGIVIAVSYEDPPVADFHRSG
jgi:hypothetical protein